MPASGLAEALVTVGDPDAATCPTAAATSAVAEARAERRSAKRGRASASDEEGVAVNAEPGAQLRITGSTAAATSTEPVRKPVRRGTGPVGPPVPGQPIVAVHSRGAPLTLQPTRERKVGGTGTHRKPSIRSAGRAAPAAPESPHAASQGGGPGAYSGTSRPVAPAGGGGNVAGPAQAGQQTKAQARRQHKEIETNAISGRVANAVDVVRERGPINTGQGIDTPAGY